MYSKQIFGAELKSKVLRKENVIDIGKWAFEMYLMHGPNIEAKFSRLMIHLNTMELGDEFALSYQMLSKIADDLIKGKDVNLNDDEYREFKQ